MTAPGSRSCIASASGEPATLFQSLARWRREILTFIRTRVTNARSQAAKRHHQDLEENRTGLPQIDHPCVWAAYRVLPRSGDCQRIAAEYNTIDAHLRQPFGEATEAADPAAGANGTFPEFEYDSYGGGRGIRTHVTVTRQAVFKTAALGHYASPPRMPAYRPLTMVVAESGGSGGEPTLGGVSGAGPKAPNDMHVPLRFNGTRSAATHSEGTTHEF